MSDRSEARHTYTILGHCPRDGLIGLAIASSPLAVASRCAFVRPGCGAVATQAYSNPAIGPWALSLLERGASPEAAIEEIRRSDPHPTFRQVGIIDRRGDTAVLTGPDCLDWKGHAIGKGYACLGNYLIGPQVVAAMDESWRKSEGDILEERLLRGIEAARNAGGDHGGPPLSAALIVYGAAPYSRTDLRVDMHDGAPDEDAIHDLRRIFTKYRPLISYYEARAKDPFLPPWKEWLATESESKAEHGESR
jgi:uncharacterized Ntn-hydrolase superfamily protein